MKGVCHYYQVLSELCIKMNFDYDDLGKVKSLHFVNGCFSDGETMKFKVAQVGSFYDFEESVNLQIRSTDDPYMILTYTRDNLGTDFRVFLYLAVVSLVGALLASSIVCYYLCCFLKKKEEEPPMQADQEQLNTKNKDSIEMQLQ